MWVKVKIRKLDNGYKGVVVERSSSYPSIPSTLDVGVIIQNRKFKPYSKGTLLDVIFNVTWKGRRVLKFIKVIESMPYRVADETRDEREKAIEVEREWRKVSEAYVSSSPLIVEGDGTIGFGESVPETIIAVFEPKKERVVKPKSVNEGYYVSPEARLIFNTAKGMSEALPEKAVKIMMVGGSGYGKTTLPKLFSELTGKSFLRMNCATIRDPEEWFGYREAKEGTTVFVRSSFAKAIEAGNLVVVLDEFNRLEPWLHNTLFPLLDDDGCTVVHDETFRIGPGVIVVGTINTGYKYTGTFELDEALYNRFDFVLEVGAMPHTEEVNVLCKRTGIDKEMAAIIVKTGNILRQSDVVCSTRTTLLIANMIRSSMTVREAFESAVVRRIPSDTSGSGLRKQVVDLVNVQLGPFEPRTLEGDVFNVSGVLEKPAPFVESSPVLEALNSGAKLYLERTPGMNVLVIKMIQLLRTLDVVNASGEPKTFTLREAHDLASELEAGESLTIPLTGKPDNFEHLVTELKRAGVSGRYTFKVKLT